MDETYTLQGITFVWDSEKATKNDYTHKISFETACEAFFDPFLRVMDASRNDESRDGLVGMNKTGHLLFVVHIVQEEERIRIISARKATIEERKFYENV